MRTITPLLLLSLFACNPDDGASNPDDGRIEGRVTNSGGSQFGRLAGSGSVDAASKVKAYAVAEDGALQALSGAAVAADGTWSMDLEPGLERVLIRALDRSGETVGSVILESTGNAMETVTCAPVDTESSVEAETWLNMLALGDADANPIDVRSRIDSATAIEVRSQSDAAADATLEALAEALSAAQQTEVDSYARSGLMISQDDLFAAEIEAALVLAQDLDEASAEGTGVEMDYDRFFADLDAAARSLGASDTEIAAAERHASASFRLTLNARTEADATNVVEAASLVAARHEARASDVAVEAILDAADAGTHVRDAMDYAVRDLRTDVTAATSFDAAASAYDTFSAEILGNGDVETSVLGTYLDLDTTTAATVQGAVDTALGSAANLDAELALGVDSALSSGSEVDAQAVSQAVLSAYDAHRVAVRTALESALLGYSQTEVDASIDLTVSATGALSSS